LGIESTAYGFIGDNNNGDLFLKLLEPYNIKTDFTKTKCDSRMNFKIISGDGDSTEFNESGGPIDLTEKEDILNKIKNIIDDVDFFFMGGSVPPGIEKSIYRDIINLGGERTKFIIDCDGEAFKFCMNNKKKPYIIKPNQFELEQYCGKKFDLTNDSGLRQIYDEVEKIYRETGVKVLCTLGEYGAVYNVEGKTYIIEAPKVEVKGFTGAGDTFLAAFCAAYFGLFDFGKIWRASGGITPDGYDISRENAALFGVIAASAKVTKPGTEFATLDEITAMCKKMREKKN